MRRTLVALAVATLFAVVFGCSTATPTACGSEACSGDQICLKQCHEDRCAMAMPTTGQCPAGYLAIVASGGDCCAHAAPAPHCVVPAEATQQDCAPYGQLVLSGGSPSVECLCLD